MMRSMPPRPPCPSGVTTRTRSARTRADRTVEQTKIDFRYSGLSTQNQMPPITSRSISKMHLTGVMAACRREPGEDDDVRLDAKSGADMFLCPGRPWTAGFSGPAFVASEPPSRLFLARPRVSAGTSRLGTRPSVRQVSRMAPVPPTLARRILRKPTNNCFMGWFGRSRRHRVIPFRME